MEVPTLGGTDLVPVAKPIVSSWLPNLDLESIRPSNGNQDELLANEQEKGSGSASQHLTAMELEAPLVVHPFLASTLIRDPPGVCSACSG